MDSLGSRRPGSGGVELMAELSGLVLDPPPLITGEAGAEASLKAAHKKAARLRSSGRGEGRGR